MKENKQANRKASRQSFRQGGRNIHVQEVSVQFTNLLMFVFTSHETEVKVLQFLNNCPAKKL